MLSDMAASQPAGGKLAGVEGQAFELSFLFGSSALGVLVGVALLLRPAWTVPVWWVFTLLVEGPHLLGTLTRTYLDPRDRRRLGPALWLVPLWTLPGPLCVLAARFTGSQVPWDLFLLAAALWSYHHFIRQHFGLLASAGPAPSRPTPGSTAGSSRGRSGR
jgi:hypothetical protein